MSNYLITGASTGIGRASALAIAKLGHTVWAGVRSKKAFEDLTKLHVDGLKPILLDVEKSDSIRTAHSLILKESGTLHGLVNNAGIVVGGPIEGIALEDWRKQFEVNFFGLIEITQICLPALRESKGRIVNMSSISGRVAAPFTGPYSASKFALEAYSDSLRRELAPFGVSVSVIEPGPIRTPIWKKSLQEGEKLRGKLSPEVERIYGKVLDKFILEVEKQAANGDPVGVVVDAVAHALESRRPKTRYPVGRGISVASALSGVLPDRIFDRVLLLKGGK